MPIKYINQEQRLQLFLTYKIEKYLFVKLNSHPNFFKQITQGEVATWQNHRNGVKTPLPMFHDLLIASLYVFHRHVSNSSQKSRTLLRMTALKELVKKIMKS